MKERALEVVGKYHSGKKDIPENMMPIWQKPLEIRIFIDSLPIFQDPPKK